MEKYHNWKLFFKFACRPGKTLMVKGKDNTLIYKANYQKQGII